MVFAVWMERVVDKRIVKNVRYMLRFAALLALNDGIARHRVLGGCAGYSMPS